jgi:hypothetical protein
LIQPLLKKEPFHMPTTIATRHGLSPARAHTTSGFSRFGSVEAVLAAWALAVLVIGAVACFAPRPFIGAFDVSVAAF